MKGATHIDVAIGTLVSGLSGVFKRPDGITIAERAQIFRLASPLRNLTQNGAHLVCCHWRFYRVPPQVFDLPSL